MVSLIPEWRFPVYRNSGFQRPDWCDTEAGIFKKFAASSEKSKPEVNQTLLFDEAENTADHKEPEPEVEEIAGYKRRKRKASSKSVKDDFNNIPVEEVVHEHPGGIPVCPECGEQMSFMGYYSVKSLVIVPASVKVVNNLYPQYVCRRCEKENIHTPIIKQDMPKQVIKGSCASPSIVVSTATI